MVFFWNDLVFGLKLLKTYRFFLVAALHNYVSKPFILWLYGLLTFNFQEPDGVLLGTPGVFALSQVGI